MINVSVQEGKFSYFFSSGEEIEIPVEIKVTGECTLFDMCNEVEFLADKLPLYAREISKFNVIDLIIYLTDKLVDMRKKAEEQQQSYLKVVGFAATRFHVIDTRRDMPYAVGCYYQNGSVSLVCLDSPGEPCKSYQSIHEFLVEHLLEGDTEIEWIDIPDK